MYREQCSNNNVTRYVCYNSPFTGLGRVSMMGPHPKGQYKQQTEHHPGPVRLQQRSRS